MGKEKLIKPYYVKIKTENDSAYAQIIDWNSKKTSNLRSDNTGDYVPLPRLYLYHRQYLDDIKLKYWNPQSGYNTKTYTYYIWKGAENPTLSSLRNWTDTSLWSPCIDPGAVGNATVYYIETKYVNLENIMYYKYQLYPTLEYAPNSSQVRNQSQTTNYLMSFQESTVFNGFNPLLSPCLLYCYYPTSNEFSFENIFNQDLTTIYVDGVVIEDKNSYAEEKMGHLGIQQFIMPYASQTIQEDIKSENITYSIVGATGSLVEKEKTEGLCTKPEEALDNIPIKITQDHIVIFPSSTGEKSEFLDTVVNGENIKITQFVGEGNNFAFDYNVVLNKRTDYIVVRYPEKDGITQEQGISLSRANKVYSRESSFNIGISSLINTDTTITSVPIKNGIANGQLTGEVVNNETFKGYVWIAYTGKVTDVNNGYYISIEQWANGTPYN